MQSHQMHWTLICVYNNYSWCTASSCHSSVTCGCSGHLQSHKQQSSEWVSNSTHNKLWPIKKCHPFSLYCSFCKCWPTALIFDVWYKTASNLINVALQIYSIYGGQNVRNWLTFIVGTAIKWKRVAFLWTTVYITLEMKLSGQPTATTMRDHSHTWPTYRPYNT